MEQQEDVLFLVLMSIVMVQWEPLPIRMAMRAWIRATVPASCTAMATCTALRSSFPAAFNLGIFDLSLRSKDIED